MNKIRMTGKIVSIEPIGQVENQYGIMEKYRVKFDNNDILSFKAKGEFKKRVGETILYDKYPQQGNGSVVYEKPINDNEQYNDNRPTQKTIDTQEKIVRQSMLKAAVDFHATNHGKSEQQVLQTAQLFIDFINQ